MKAVLLDGFGGLEVLKVGKVDKPAPKEGEVLIQVAATSINRITSYNVCYTKLLRTTRT